MDTLFSRVSDEELFFLMTLGDKFAQDILIRRYEYLGRQMAGVFIRQKGLKNVTDQDFVDEIHDAIFKAFRYYSFSGKPFTFFCRDLLNQNLVRVIEELVLDYQRMCERIDLDGQVRLGAETLNHEIICNQNNLSLARLYDVDEFLMKLSSSNSLELQIVAKIYLLHEMGYTIREIVRYTKISNYQVRRVIANPKKAFEDSKRVLKLK